MSVTDPISDLLTRVRNANMVRHEVVLVPASKMKVSIVRILKEEGFIRNYEVVRDTPQGTIKIRLDYPDRNTSALHGLRRVSKPGWRVYVQRQEIPRVYGGLGIAILTTPKGVMTGQQAWRQQVGGEVLCYVW